MWRSDEICSKVGHFLSAMNQAGRVADKRRQPDG